MMHPEIMRMPVRSVFSGFCQRLDRTWLQTKKPIVNKVGCHVALSERIPYDLSTE